MNKQRRPLAPFTHEIETAFQDVQSAEHAWSTATRRGLRLPIQKPRSGATGGRDHVRKQHGDIRQGPGPKRRPRRGGATSAVINLARAVIDPLPKAAVRSARVFATPAPIPPDPLPSQAFIAVAALCRATTGS